MAEVATPEVQSFPHDTDSICSEENHNPNNLTVSTNTVSVSTTDTTQTPTSLTKTLVTPLSSNLTPKFKLELPLSLNIKNLFESQKPKLDLSKKPKNIDKLDALAKPLQTNKKFIQQLAEEQAALKQSTKPNELPEPKNIEFLKRISVPLNKVEKFDPEAEEAKAKEAAKSTNVRELPAPKNKDILERLSSPLPRNVTKKFSQILDEEKEQVEKTKKLTKKYSSVKSPKSTTTPKNTTTVEPTVSESTDDAELAAKTVDIQVNDTEA